MSAQPVRSIVLVGRDAPVWIAAACLHRALGRLGVEIQVLEMPPAVGPADVYACLPTLESLHALMGLRHEDVLAAAAGTFVLGQRFSGFARGAPDFLHAYDNHGARHEHIDFHQLWLRARAAGLQTAFEDFSLGATAAKHGRFALLSEEASGFSNALHGCHLDATAYGRALRAAVVALGVRVIRSNIVAIPCTDDGAIAHIQLDDGGTLEADLFLDISGDAAILARALPGDQVQDWSNRFGVNRILTASAPALQPTPAFAHISAHRHGWVGLYPLQDRLAVVCAYDSAEVSDADILANLPVLSGQDLKPGAYTRTLKPGRRTMPWRGNCVALGAAALQIEPLDGVELHTLQQGLVELITHFPVDTDFEIERKSFNRRMVQRGDCLSGFVQTHYLLNKRFDEPFWDHGRQGPVDEGLARRLEGFAARGLLRPNDHDTFEPDSWLALFLGHGLIPDDYDPQADFVDQQVLIPHFQRILRFIAAEAAQMPSLDAHIEMHATRAPVG